MNYRAVVSGCFDIIHVGHIRLIQFAAQFGELSILINTDETIRELKGPDRPIHSLAERIEILRSNKNVSRVIPFTAKTPTLMLDSMYTVGIGPHFVVKGPDYIDKEIPERSVIESNGGLIMFYPEPKIHSTTDMLRRLS